MEGVGWASRRRADYLCSTTSTAEVVATFLIVAKALGYRRCNGADVYECVRVHVAGTASGLFSRGRLLFSSALVLLLFAFLLLVAPSFFFLFAFSSCKPSHATQALQPFFSSCLGLLFSVIAWVDGGVWSDRECTSPASKSHAGTQKRKHAPACVPYVSSLRAWFAFSNHNDGAGNCARCTFFFCFLL